MKLFFLLFLVLVHHHPFLQNNEQVKSVSVVSRQKKDKSNLEGDKFEWSKEFDREGKVLSYFYLGSKMYYKYDSLGRVTELQLFRKRLNNERLVQTVQYRYAQDSIIETTWKIDRDSRPTIKITIEKRDSNDNIIREIILKNNQVVPGFSAIKNVSHEYEYDSLNRIITDSTYIQNYYNTAQLEVFNYQYSGSTIIIHKSLHPPLDDSLSPIAIRLEEQTFHPNDSLATWKIERYDTEYPAATTFFKYDNRGNITKYYQIEIRGKKSDHWRRHTYKYDQNGRIVTDHETQKIGKKKTKAIYTYSYTYW